MTDEAWTPLRLIAWTQGFFAKGGVDAPRLTAELLLAHALSCDRMRLYLDFDKPLGAPELTAFRELVRRRAAGEPTAWLTGRREFLGHAFRVTPDVLVPRPETELLVEAALAALPQGGAAASTSAPGRGASRSRWRSRGPTPGWWRPTSPRRRWRWPADERRRAGGEGGVRWTGIWTGRSRQGNAST